MEFQLFLIKYQIPHQKDVDLRKKTWIKTGGRCAYWVVPESVSQLVEVCKFLYATQMQFYIVGQTSNLFFHSSYNPEVIVSTIKINKYQIDNDILTCECGVNVMKLSKELLSAGYAGFYGLVGLPGTVASALWNNAGCFNCSLSSMLLNAEVLMPNGSICTIDYNGFEYRARSSAFKRGELKGIILSVQLKIERALDKIEELSKSEETIVYRKMKQEGPRKNLGSVFSSLKRKHNVRNRIASAVSKVIGHIGIADQNRIDKLVLLWLYGYWDLRSYISDKQINTFVWRNEKAEYMFSKYKEFMGQVFSGLTMEIEELK